MAPTTLRTTLGEGRMNQMAHCMAAAVTPKRIALGGETARTG